MIERELLAALRRLHDQVGTVTLLFNVDKLTDGSDSLRIDVISGTFVNPGGYTVLATEMWLRHADTRADDGPVERDIVLPALLSAIERGKARLRLDIAEAERAVQRLRQQLGEP